MIDQRFLTICCAAIGLACAGTALAFGGGARRIEHVPSGTEFVAGHGDRSFAAEARAASPGFVARHGGTWFERRGGPTGDFRRIWGEGSPVSPAAMADGPAALAAARTFWRENGDLLPAGVVAADLEPVVNHSFRGVRIVTFRQTVDGVPVLGTTAHLAILAGRIVLVGVRAFPVTGVETRPVVEAGAARATALGQVAARGVGGAAAGAPVLALMPVTGDDSLELRPVWTVALAAPGGLRFTAFVDARSGGLAALRDERLFVTGELRGRHHDRHPGNAVIDSPLADLYVQTNAGESATDHLGQFTADGTETDLMALLSGKYVQVRNMHGADLLLDVSGVGAEPHLWDLEGDEEGFAQIHGYHFVSRVRDHAHAIAPDLMWTMGVQQVNVNQTDLDDDGVTDACNAWFDGVSLNTLMAGDLGYGYSCNNTAMIGDILYHEYGHAFHYQSTLLGAMAFDEAVSEGLADTMSVSITLDPIIAPYFTTGGYAIRDLEPDKVWPQDQSEDPHATGLIVGGALWDLRKALREELGVDAGDQALDDLYAQVARTTTDVPSLFEATLLADDDNGNLADGTPGFCLIYDAYAPHGLTGDGVGRIVIDHEQLIALDDPSLPVAVSADVWVASEECNTLGAVRLVYSVDGGASWTTAEMAGAGGDAYQAGIGVLAEGTELFYRIEADELDSGDVIARPHNAAEPFYRAYVGPLDEIRCDDFEDGEGEWTHELVEGVAREGADDWQLGQPVGKGGDPVGAWSGQYVWGNDLAPLANWNGKYQPSKTNALTGPAWDLSGYEQVRLRFRRWLTVEDGYFDQARVLIGVGGEWQQVWVNRASAGGADAAHDTHHIDREWILFDLDISELAAGQPEVRVRFEMRSDAGLEFGGWTIDDVCLYTKGEPPENDTDQDGGPAAEVLSGKAGGCGCDAAGRGTAAGLAGLLSRLI
jgi:hypothetical protein